MIKIFLRNASPEIEKAAALKIKAMLAGSNGRIELTRAKKTVFFGDLEKD